MPAETPRTRRAPDAGISTVELVIIAPILMLFVLVLVGFGLLVQARSSLDGAARDAARAGALQRDYNSATSAAQQAAAADAANICAGGNVLVTPSGTFTPGGMFTATVSCDVRGLRMLGLGWTTRVTASSTAPLDVYRRTVQ